MSATFLTPLDTRRLNGSGKRQLIAPFAFRCDSLGRAVLVPDGFVYDGPSIPLNWGGAGERASCGHDYMYSQPDLFTRSEADNAFLELLEADGMGWLRRHYWWLGVRAAGWNHYGKDKTDENDAAVRAADLDGVRPLS